MPQTAICSMCDWRYEAPTKKAAVVPWNAHVNAHMSFFRNQLDIFGIGGFEVCAKCVASRGSKHRPCYNVICNCECSC